MVDTFQMVFDFGVNVNKANKDLDAITSQVNNLGKAYEKAAKTQDDMFSKNIAGQALGELGSLFDQAIANQTMAQVGEMFTEAQALGELGGMIDQAIMDQTVSQVADMFEKATIDQTMSQVGDLINQAIVDQTMAQVGEMIDQASVVDRTMGEVNEMLDQAIIDRSIAQVNKMISQNQRTSEMLAALDVHEDMADMSDLFNGIIEDVKSFGLPATTNFIKGERGDSAEGIGFDPRVIPMAKLAGDPTLQELSIVDVFKQAETDADLFFNKNINRFKEFGTAIKTRVVDEVKQLAYHLKIAAKDTAKWFGTTRIGKFAKKIGDLGAKMAGFASAVIKKASPALSKFGSIAAKTSKFGLSKLVSGMSVAGSVMSKLGGLTLAAATGGISGIASIIKGLFNWKAALASFLPEASKLEVITTETGAQMGLTRKEIIGAAYDLAELASASGATVEDIGKLQNAFAEVGENFADAFSPDKQVALTRMVDTLGVSAEATAEFAMQSKLLGEEFSDLLGETAQISKQFGVKGMFKATPKVVQGVVDLFGEFGDTVKGNSRDIIKGTLKAGAAIAKGLGTTVSKGIDMAMGAVKKFSGSLRNTRDVMLGLADDFDPLTNAMLEGGVPLARIQDILEKGKDSPLAFANAIKDAADRARAFGGDMAAERLLRGVAMQADDATRKLLQVPGALKAANEAQKESNRIEDERQANFGKGIAFFTETASAMRQTGKTAMSVLKNMFDLSKEIVRLTLGDQLRGLIETLIGSDKDGKRAGGLLKLINDQLISFTRNMRGVGKIKQMFGPITSFVTKFFGDITEIFEGDEGFVTKIQKAFSASWENIKTGASDLFDVIKPTLQSAFKGMAGLLIDSLDSVSGDGMGKFFDSVLSHTALLLTSMNNAILDNSPQIVKVWGSLMRVVGLVIGAGLKSIGKFVAAFFLDQTGPMADLRTSIFELWIHNIKMIFAAIKGLATGLIEGLVGDSMENLKLKFEDALLDIKSIFVKTFDEIRNNAISSLASAIVPMMGIARAVGTVNDKVQSAVDAFDNATTVTSTGMLGKIADRKAAIAKKIADNKVARAAAAQAEADKPVKPIIWTMPNAAKRQTEATERMEASLDKLAKTMEQGLTDLVKQQEGAKKQRNAQIMAAEALNKTKNAVRGVFR